MTAILYSHSCPFFCIYLYMFSSLHNTRRDEYILHTFHAVSLIIHNVPVLHPVPHAPPAVSCFLCWAPCSLSPVWPSSEHTAQEDWLWACGDMAVVCHVYVIALTCLQALPLYQISTATLGSWWCCCQPIGTGPAVPCTPQLSWKTDR